MFWNVKRKNTISREKNQQGLHFLDSQRTYPGPLGSHWTGVATHCIFSNLECFGFRAHHFAKRRTDSASNSASFCLEKVKRNKTKNTMFLRAALSRAASPAVLAAPRAALPRRPFPPDAFPAAFRKEEKNVYSERTHEFWIK